MEELGELIRKQRKEMGLTQAALASQLGMSRITISKIEKGIIPEIGIRKVEAILRVLGYQLTAVPVRGRPTLDDLRRSGFHD